MEIGEDTADDKRIREAWECIDAAYPSWGGGGGASCASALLRDSLKFHVSSNGEVQEDSGAVAMVHLYDAEGNEFFFEAGEETGRMTADSATSGKTRGASHCASSNAVSNRVGTEIKIVRRYWEGGSVVRHLDALYEIHRTIGNERTFAPHKSKECEEDRSDEDDGSTTGAEGGGGGGIEVGVTTVEDEGEARNYEDGLPTPPWQSRAS